MNKESTVNVIRGQVDLGAAVESAQSVAAGQTVVAERSVLYPYIAFGVCCTVPTIAGSRTVSMNCLVDGLNDFGATADPYETDRVPVSGAIRLAPRIGQRRAARTAWRAVTHGLCRKLRMIAAFGVRLEAAGVVYKRFWILQVGNARVMTDSVTGHLHPLNAVQASSTHPAHRHALRGRSSPAS